MLYVYDKYMKGVMGYTLKEGRSKKEGKGRWKSHVNRKERTGHLCKLRSKRCHYWEQRSGAHLWLS